MKNHVSRLAWIDGIKGFAIIGILVNHFVESFIAFPWSSYPSYNWPEFSERISKIFPAGENIFLQIVTILGRLGDMCPGVFILVSGFSLTLSSFMKNEKEINFRNFYKKRLLRIMPLYLVIHIIVLVCGVLLGDGNINLLASPSVFLSMLGLRFTDKLFFYINPSWWFIWLIIQLYLVFPFLFRLLTKAGIKTFILITFSFTVLSRAAGLFNVTYSNSLEYWMMGIFFGTRLLEFGVGMVLAKLFFEKKFEPEDISKTRLLVISLIIYLFGYGSHLFYSTTLFSNTLITIGLSGLFLAFWRIIETYLSFFKKTIIWIGIASFPVFLIHQPFMGWLTTDYDGLNKAIILLLFLLVVFPISRFIEWIINQVVIMLPNIKSKIVFYLIIISLSLQTLLNLLFFVTQYNSIYMIDVLFFILNIFFIPLYCLLGNKITSHFLKTIIYTFLPASVIFCFILTRNWFNVFWIFIIIQLIGVLGASLLTQKLLLRVVFSFSFVLFLIVVFENWLAINHPVEVNRWGELPALQKDTLTVYSLKPDKETHLKYNNYDYIVKTNSLGFNGPEVMLSKKDTDEIRVFIIGDAFTMPEGMEYQEAYPELLQAQLSENYPHRKIRVFNGGVTGYGPNEMYGQLKKHIDTLKPDIFINQLFINEFQEINLDAKARLHSLSFTKLPLREEWFSGSQIPRQASLKLHKLLHDKIYNDYTYYKSLAYYYDKHSDLYSSKTINKLRNYLQKIKALCEKNNCKLVMLYAPGQLEISTPVDIEYYPSHFFEGGTTKYDLGLPKNKLRDLCSEEQITFLDPSLALKSNPKQPTYFRESWHWNLEGHKVIATFLNQEISKYLILK